MARRRIRQHLTEAARRTLSRLYLRFGTKRGEFLVHPRQSFRRCAFAGADLTGNGIDLALSLTFDACSLCLACGFGGQAFCLRCGGTVGRFAPLGSLGYGASGLGLFSSSALCRAQWPGCAYPIEPLDRKVASVSFYRQAISFPEVFAAVTVDGAATTSIEFLAGSQSRLRCGLGGLDVIGPCAAQRGLYRPTFDLIILKTCIKKRQIGAWSVIVIALNPVRISTKHLDPTARRWRLAGAFFVREALRAFARTLAIPINVITDA